MLSTAKLWHCMVPAMCLNLECNTWLIGNKMTNLLLALISICLQDIFYYCLWCKNRVYCSYTCIILYYKSKQCSKRKCNRQSRQGQVQGYHDRTAGTKYKHLNHNHNIEHLTYTVIYLKKDFSNEDYLGISVTC